MFQSWFWVALNAPACWGVSNHIDKFLLSRYVKDNAAGALLIFSALIGLLLLPIIAVIEPNVGHISWNNMALIICNGIFSVLGYIPYMYAMSRDEASTVVPLFQIIPIFVYLLGYFFLGEVISQKQLFGMGIILTGSIGLNIDFTQEKVKVKYVVLLLMFTSCVVHSITNVIYKYVVNQETFWVTKFWEYVGFSFMAFVFFTIVPSYRKSFLTMIRFGGRRLVKINLLNEAITICGFLTMNYAQTLTATALALSVNGFQPLFVLIYGTLITKFFPRLGKENVEKKFMVQKIINVILICCGAMLLNMNG